MNIEKPMVKNGLMVALVLLLVHHAVTGGWASTFTALRRAAVATSDWAGSLVSVPVWLLGIISAVVLTALGAAVLVASARARKRETGSAPITKAEIFGIRWRWNYHEGDIREITSYCPKCDLPVIPKKETRHGFLHLISYQCACGKWRSKSFQCSQVDFIDRVCRTIQKQART